MTTNSEQPVASYKTAAQCVEAAQLHADEGRYGEALSTLEECEREFGSTIKLVPTFPE